MTNHEAITRVLTHAQSLGLDSQDVARLQRRMAADEARSRGQAMSDERDFVCAGDELEPDVPEVTWPYIALMALALVIIAVVTVTGAVQ